MVGKAIAIILIGVAGCAQQTPAPPRVIEGPIVPDHPRAKPRTPPVPGNELRRAFDDIHSGIDETKKRIDDEKGR